jgi:hypothetical protein
VNSAPVLQFSRHWHHRPHKMVVQWGQRTFQLQEHKARNRILIITRKSNSFYTGVAEARQCSFV